MPTYLNLSGRSGVSSYDCGDDWIEVTFIDGVTYRYTNESVGASHVGIMKGLAADGKGLHSYIYRHLRAGFHRKS
jgi:hypothetical protein